MTDANRLGDGLGFNEPTEVDLYDTCKLTVWVDGDFFEVTGSSVLPCDCLDDVEELRRILGRINATCRKQQSKVVL